VVGHRGAAGVLLGVGVGGLGADLCRWVCRPVGLWAGCGFVGCVYTPRRKAFALAAESIGLLHEGAPDPTLLQVPGALPATIKAVRPGMC